MITKSEDMVKLRALAELCSWDFFDDKSLLVVAWRRILEVLVLAMPPVEEKKVRRKKKKQQKKNYDPRKLDILDACVALGRACGFVGDFDDARRYYKRAKEGFEEQLGRDNEKALDATKGLIMITGTTSESSEKLRDLVKRMERVLGDENVVTLETLNDFGFGLQESGEYEEAIKCYERCLAGRTKVLKEDHKDALGALNNLGTIYGKLENYEKAFEYYEKALKGNEKTLGRNHPETLGTVMNVAII
ncbi:hypothetical protein TrLO_g2767 [Triparma laevis f. longispina]|nr:hypothetical protein TrLO_g2767 [Triparma laevis f. longispina]